MKTEKVAALKYNRRQERAMDKARKRMKKRHPDESDECIEKMAHEHVFSNE